MWPAACGLGAGLLVGWGSRPTPLVERMRRLELDARVRETVDQSGERPRALFLPGELGILLGPLSRTLSATADVNGHRERALVRI